ncbi:hypothetical protein [Caenimonas soli]|uniref:hypothetical protein n=1 Tax=Caenimonas soli TaxID=2735555 RepID=UPI001553D6A6|nr:hypothetical protein [Caenimonas soli]NPC55177.1 hypothetical protein [Caenimonas soli]
MSLFSWMFTARKPARDPESSGLSRVDPTRPAAKRGPGNDDAANNGQPANRKSERMARRELLYSVVREAMTRAGVLSASYKFKVLSLDARGRQFLVMVDLARNYGGETSRLAEIEALVAQGAKSRYDILVSAVYWRMNEHVAVGDPNAQLQQRPGDSKPAPLESAVDSQPAVLESGPAPLEAAPEARKPSRYDPIQADEVAAFKRALASGVANPAAAAAAAVGVPHGASARAFDGSSRSGPQSYTLLTGFEDTELPDALDRRAPELSGTQYGDLN